MDLFKEKEEIEIINKSIDPEFGVNLGISNLENLDLDSLKTNSTKNNIFKKNHMGSKKIESEIEMVEEEFNHKISNEEEIVLEHPPEDIQEALISINELLDFLDNNEEEINV